MKSSKPIKENKISVVIPVYNEETAVASFMQELTDVMDKTGFSYEIIAVNDKSKDKSGSILEKLRSRIKNLKVLHHDYNKGYGASIKTGIRNSDGEFILISDADGTYPAKEIPLLLRHIKDYDMVVGARTGKNVHIPFLRKPAKFMLNMLARTLTGINIPDLNSGLRVFRRDLAYEFWNMYPERFSFTTTITLASLTNDYSVKFIPIDYLKRRGKSSIHPIKDFANFNMIIYKVIMYFKPLKFFIPSSILFLILAALRGIRDFRVESSLGDLTVMLFLVSVIIFFFGMLADLIIKRVK